MVAIRQTVTVGAGGRVEVQSPDLKESARAEAIVTGRAGRRARLAAFDQLQKGLNLDPARAAEWSKHVREERQSSGPRG